MPVYDVVLKETLVYTMRVKADTEEQAEAWGSTIGWERVDYAEANTSNCEVDVHRVPCPADNGTDIDEVIK